MKKLGALLIASAMALPGSAFAAHYRYYSRGHKPSDAQLGARYNNVGTGVGYVPAFTAHHDFYNTSGSGTSAGTQNAQIRESRTTGGVLLP